MVQRPTIDSSLGRGAAAAAAAGRAAHTSTVSQERRASWKEEGCTPLESSEGACSHRWALDCPYGRKVWASGGKEDCDALRDEVVAGDGVIASE
jgi:hypothetical protein